MPGQQLTTIAGNTFVVSDLLGDIKPGEAQGLFTADTRFLSCYELRLGELEPILLRSGAAGFSETHIYATNAETDRLHPHTVELIRRRRLLKRGLVESIELTNRGLEEIEIPLSLAIGADFADIFEVRAIRGTAPPRRSTQRKDNDDLVFYDRYRGEERSTRISFSPPPKSIRRGKASFAVLLGPRQRWTLEVRVECTIPTPATTHPVPVPRMSQEEPVVQWLQEVPKLVTDHRVLQPAYDRAVRDLAALEIALNSGYPIPAAGLPWYMAIFGRDSIITSLQTLLLGPRLAYGTLRTLAAYQAVRDSAFRDAEPGKIAHEIRFGELATSEEIPHARYYGTVDATPLWLILLAECYRWTGDRQLVEDLLPAAERALEWIDRYGDLDGDGLVEYRRRSRRGLDNHGWKDSWDSVRFADGRFAEPPIALVEVQGYVYAAKQAMAGLYELLDRPGDAQRLRQEAESLKRIVHEAFWMPDEGFYALALDRHKRQVDAVTSNPGHLLWAGLPDEPYAGQIVERLLSSDMYSGWGIRTMSVSMAAYNPISYHNGSIWPHDNSLIVSGLKRYGYRQEALQVITSMVEAARMFEHYRLPELFCGYERGETPFPIDYPVACSPQAWAAGSIILMLQTLAGVNPNGVHLVVDPIAQSPAFRLEGVFFRGHRVNVAAAPVATASTTGGDA